MREIYINPQSIGTAIQGFCKVFTEFVSNYRICKVFTEFVKYLEEFTEFVKYLQISARYCNISVRYSDESQENQGELA